MLTTLREALKETPQSKFPPLFSCIVIGYTREIVDFINLCWSNPDPNLSCLKLTTIWNLKFFTFRFDFQPPTLKSWTVFNLELPIFAPPPLFPLLSIVCVAVLVVEDECLLLQTYFSIRAILFNENIDIKGDSSEILCSQFPS